MDQSQMESIVFLVQSPDQKGLVSQISTFFYRKGFNILSCQEHVDVSQDQYFMRIGLDMSDLNTSRKELEDEFQSFGEPLHLNWSVYYSNQMARVALLVTKAPHCLYDILVRHEQNELNCEIPLIVSNHPHLESIAEKFRIPFYCMPIENKAERHKQEQQIIQLLTQNHIDLIVLARYMQILSESFTEAYAGKIINIHHAFLPAFKGANPYKNAYERGVKMIGATAHYVSPELDEGPIIEQTVERVDHGHSVEDLVAVGRDVESITLARAVKLHTEQRVFLNGHKTVVLR